ncbi:MAG TPA: hypothetical protein VFA07_12155 [Chthonomonadaceae bacterium]|nr:hypothetical protein [Chthonomonadaceae bacterium]
METRKRYRLWLVGTTLGILIALLLAPATRWLVWAQLNLALPRQSSLAPLRYLFTKPSDADNAYVERRLSQAAERHPDDLQVQIAAILMTPMKERTPSMFTDRPLQEPGSLTLVSRLRALEARFPDSPALRAAILRMATQAAIRIHRDEEEAQAMGEAYSHSNARLAPYADTQEQLAAFDADAAQGEQLDPGNAYFPLMRVVGLFAAHRDAEALATLQRAAEKPRWEEYIADEEEGRWRLQEEAFGDYGTTARVVAYAAILFPHYAQFRAEARMALSKAIEAEKAGRVEEGLAIRDAVLECGSRMRVQSRSVIGSLVGIAIESIAVVRPGGAPSMKFKNSVPGEQRRKLRLQAYENWLRQIGHPEESERVDAEVEAGQQASQIIRTAINSNAYVFGAPLGRLAGWWVAGLLTLANALWMLALGGVAALWARSRRLRSGQPLPRFARWSVVLGLIAGAILTMGLLFSDQVVAGSIAAGFLFPGIPWPNFGLAVLVLGIGALVFSGPSWKQRLFGLGVFASSALGVFLLIRLTIWQAEGARVFLSFFRMFYGMSEGTSPLPPALTWVSGLALAIPLLTVSIFGLLSRIYRVPLSVGLVRGLRGIAVPVACILFLAYSGLVVGTLRQEAMLQKALDRQVQHEGRYLAEIAGRTWPPETH